MIVAARAEEVIAGTDASVLDAISDPQCALACWQRARVDAPTHTLDAIDFGKLADIRTVIDLTSAEADIEAALALAGYPAPTASMLVGDIAMLARLHGAILRASEVTMRLELVETDACRRFHADYVTTRLITTYSGPGTQWVEHDRPEAIRQIETGEVAIFKGRMLMPDPPILHRSPPIMHTGDKRLLLVIDPVKEALS